MRKPISWIASLHLSNPPPGLFCFLFVLSLFACGEKKDEKELFEVMDSEFTGLDFSNRLESTDSLNLFKYMYFYNGAGLGAGDFNNDGLIDLFFASNQGSNTLYLNEGKLRFRDVTKAAGVPDDHAWNTGVSVVDINNDGLLDIYICRVGKYRSLNSKNQFLICQGLNAEKIPVYKDMAREYGVDFSGFGSQAAFLDYDKDGDLDLFLLNHSVHENGTFRARNEFIGTSHPTTGSKLFRNDSAHFSDATKSSGINSTAIGYGLGVVVSDINNDGYPDMYIGNDFHENDYLYINQKDGTFIDDITRRVMHTSQFTMGVDAADVNNDGLPDIISADMLPEDPYILKRSLGEDDYDIFFLKISYGYNYQYTRNNLQFNRGNGNFSELGLYSGVAATDWSWAPLWVDFDNDGLKDLFVSNGIPKRMNDIDYINYISDQEIQQKIRDNKLDEKDQVLIDKFPQIRIPNKFYKNAGDLKFFDLKDHIGHDKGTYSNGAVYADFDNDGDLDIVVNNIDAAALLYRNTANDSASQKYLSLHLDGPEKNRNAIGARVVVFAKNERRTYEKNPVHGFLSSAEGPLLIGLEGVAPDSVLLVWPDNSYQKIAISGDSASRHLQYHHGLPTFDFNWLKIAPDPSVDSLEDITKSTNLAVKHYENSFAEFDREPLIPHMVSTEGPALAKADINRDGLEDFFLGSSKGKRSSICLQDGSGKFRMLDQPAFAADSSFEDVDAVWVDVNRDSFPDLVVASAGNEYYGRDRHSLPRLYLNDGQGHLSRRQDAFDTCFASASRITANDFNGDGSADLFLAARAVPWQYGKKPLSYLLQNDGTGKFKVVTNSVAPGLSDAGFVTDARWLDLNKDNKNDLVICGEWGTIDAYINKNGRFEKTVLCAKQGWWNFILPCDLNGDGNLDFVAGNLGMNSRLKASAKEPVRLYYNDFDGNGKKEQVLTYYVQGKEIPFANKSEMERQIPILRKKFLYAKDFAKATLDEIIDPEKLEKSELLSADFFSSAVLINKGNMQFEVQALPWEAQLSPCRDAVIVDANHDKWPDVLLAGNYYENNIEMGRYDADLGTLLINNGQGNFRATQVKGVTLKGQARHLLNITVGGKPALLQANNNDSLRVLRFVKK